ncbi:hypothetical protein F4814DRAFT_420708 [Daldinia grandis]|nr:hypothetical protein F4814DRAFT_420708 [Daldinia grandis]
METRHIIPATIITRQQPLISIRPISAKDTYALRQAVLWPNKSLSYVQLPDDLVGQHFGAFVSNSNDGDANHTGEDNCDSCDSRDSKQNPEESLVSIISLFDDGSGAARFRKFATAQLWQGKGVGFALLSYTIEAAARKGATSIWCDARQSALRMSRALP